MSLVVGLVHSRQVYMGTDSAEVGEPLTLGRQVSLVRIQSLLLGFPNTNLVVNYLSHKGAVIPALMSMDLDEFVVSDFVNRLYLALGKAMADSAAAERAHEGEARTPLDPNEQASKVERDFLVGGCGHLFTVWSNGRVVEALDGYDAVGNGAAAALGALYATRGQPPDARVTSALHASERLTGTVRRPFHLACLDSTADCTGPHDATPHLRAI